MFKRSKPKKETEKELSVVLYDVPGGEQMSSAAAVKGREVAIFRPPVMLSQDGKSLPGVSRDLVARYLVSSVSALVQSDLGAVEVEWVAQHGRFCETAFHIQTWGQSIELVHPIAPVSQELANSWEIYKAGIALKARELHKGHQRFGEANAMIQKAGRNLESLRDDQVPHFTDGEYLFLQAAFQKGLVMSALLPDCHAEPELVSGTTTIVSSR